MNNYRSTLTTCLFAAAIVTTLPAPTIAADPPTENDYYQIVKLPIPDDVYLEVGALEMSPDGKLYATSRRGDIYSVTNPLGDPAQMVFKKFAGGLHEVLGASYRDGALYITQRGEVTRITDTDDDGRGDLYETVSDFWGISGDYHEYAFGSKFDREGNLWVVLCLTGSFSVNSPYRGWCLRVQPDGKTVPTCPGIRSPGGIGMNHEGEMFYTDNQGPWNGTSGLKHLRPGSFQGHPASLIQHEEAGLGKTPRQPQSGSRWMIEAKKIPQLEPTAVFFPYNKMGQSASGIAADPSNGKFGPFSNQLFVGDQTHSTVMRVFLEKVKGHYQGVCFPFRSGFGSGSLALRMSKTGQLFVGGTNRGWGSRGNKPYALERLDWTGKLPFEVHEMRIKPDGFELTFTNVADQETLAALDSYEIQTYTYIYQSSYGSPEVDHTKPTIKTATPGADGRSVRLVIDSLQEGHIHELRMAGVKSADGFPLLHTMAYYTANYIPE